MVVALLLSDANKPLRYKDLRRVALQCLHGVHSMWKALSILQSAVSDEELEPSTTSSTSPTRFLSAFDAHVGDCACHTRAQMLWELINFYIIPERRGALGRAITMLQEIRIQATSLLHLIDQSGRKARIRELDALETCGSVWKRIGFTRFLDIFYGYFGPPLTTSEDAQHPTPQVLHSSNHKNRRITVEAEWDINNLFLVARFLTFCLLLSEYKVAKIEPGPPIRVMVRVDFQLMYAEMEQELGLPSPQTRSADNCVKEAMQIYVSLATTNWVKKAALRLGLSNLYETLSEGLTLANHRHIWCAATYVSMSLVRASWLTFHTPVLIVIQRSCSHGEFHNIYCRVTWNPMGQSQICSASSLCEIGDPDWFDVTVVRDQDVPVLPWARLPHVVMICMSGEGTIEDFRRLHLGGNQTGHPHKGTCRDIVDYISNLENVNFARLLAHCVADHPQFPFALPDQDDEYGRVYELIQKGLGKRAADVFREARDGAEDFGTGRSTNLFTIEHVFLEFPGAVWEELKEEPTVYGCKLEC